MNRNQVRAAMADSLVLPMSVMDSEQWRGMPLVSRVVLWDLMPQACSARPREILPSRAVSFSEQLKCRRALIDLIERGPIVRTMTRPDRYALNFPPYSEYPHSGRQ